MTKKKKGTLSEEELKQRLTDLSLQYYNQNSLNNVTDLAQATEPGKLAVSLISAIAQTWGENNKELEDYIRRVSFGAGGRGY